MTNSLILDSLEIRHFRAFLHLQIERLGQVNLIIGKNNEGKTTLLEALWLYAERGSPTAIWQILRARNESKSLLSQGVPNPQERLEALKTLFYGRQDITLNVYPKPIEIGPYTSDDDALSIGVGWYKDKLNGGQLIGPRTPLLVGRRYGIVSLLQGPSPYRIHPTLQVRLRSLIKSFANCELVFA